MRISTVFRYLIGDRQAILDIASDRSALWVGLLFVLSAGLAREYDGEDLLHEPWHALFPLVASLLTSFLLFVLVFAAARRKSTQPFRFFERYRQFLGLYWMTAPLAWLYGVPYQYMLGAEGSAAMGLLTLAVVSVWRVALIIHVIRTWAGADPREAMHLVMLFAACIVLAAIGCFEVPLFAFMGGIRVSPGDQLAAGIGMCASQAAILSLPVWLFFSIRAIGRRMPKWDTPAIDAIMVQRSRGASLLAALSIFFWAAFMPFTQPQQQLRGGVERAFQARRFADALRIMSAHNREEFPPHWEPPPKFDVRARPDLIDILDGLDSAAVSQQITEHYVSRFVNWLSEPHHRWFIDEAAVLPRVERLLSSRPIGSVILDRMMQQHGASWRDPNYDPRDPIWKVVQRLGLQREASSKPSTMPSSSP